ncbi:MAG: DEAD/DEAH box helicase [Myxococcales bacterium]
MSAFDRLTAALQYQVVHTISFRALRPVQERAIDVILDGHNCVILAPTAGGKTEAAFFPLLSAMDDANWRPVSVLYLSPIRALLNDQEPRIARYADTLGRRVFKWHGDVSQSARKRFLGDPADILLTTPESLEAMLISPRVPARALFDGLRAVIVDEIHAFAADDRGAHLSALLERLTRFCARDVQRIGLSATVGNPEEILRWVRGSSERQGVVVDPGGGKRAPELSLDYVGSLENASIVMSALHPGKKRLVFVDSRRKAEEIGKLLRQRGVDAFVSHGSLGLTERRDAERAFREGQDCVIVATSALELGIDVGDLDHVLQVDSPATVASFLQRMGRTGRREGATPNCTFLATSDAAVLQAAAIVRLFQDGWVESVRPLHRAHHILAHQILGMAVEKSGVVRGDIAGWLHGTSAFSEIRDDEREALVDTMLAAGILVDQGGKLWLGPAGERSYGYAQFRALYAVFDVPKMITVRADMREVGQVDALFLQVLVSKGNDPSFTLGGQPWQVVHVDWERGICVVRPAVDGRAAKWSGEPRFLSYEVCQGMKQILLEDQVDPIWSQRARNVLETMRAEHGFLREGRELLDGDETIEWWTFAGGAANTLLGRMFERELGGGVFARNTRLTLKDAAGESMAAVRGCIRLWCEHGLPTLEDALELAPAAAGTELSKFEQCLPEAQKTELQRTRLFDVDGARRVVDAHSARLGDDVPVRHNSPTERRPWMKILSVKQPWASLICAGIKDIENRSRFTPHRGRIAIQAGLDDSLLRQLAADMGRPLDDSVFPRGVVLGTVELEDVALLESQLETNLWASGPYCWKLTGAHFFQTPIPAKGQLGLVVMQEALVDAVLEAEKKLRQPNLALLQEVANAALNMD